MDQDEPLTIEEVLTERDPDTQRVLVNRYGVGRFMADARAVPVAHDRYGTLLRIRIPDGEPLLILRVVNSTPEPDGSRRRFAIRVPPHLDTPIAAVAWTFGLRADQYRARLRAQT
jgi:hypothetical protein